MTMTEFLNDGTYNWLQDVKILVEITSTACVGIAVCVVAYAVLKRWG